MPFDRPSHRASHALLASVLARLLRASGRLLSFWIVARLFTVAQTGTFAVWLAVGTFASLVGDLGLGEHIMRSAPGAGSRGLIRTAIRVRLVAGGTALVVAFALALGTGVAADVGGAGTILFAAAIGLADFLAAVRRAQGRFWLEAVESALGAFGAVIAAVVVVGLSVTFVTFQLTLGLVSLAIVVARIGALGEDTLGSAARERLAPGQLLFESRWLWLKSIVGWSFLDATTLLLSWLTNSVEVALFAGAARLVGIMTQPLIALNWVFMPALAHVRVTSPQSFRSGVRRLNLIGLAAVPAGIAVCALLGRLALAGFGEDYSAALPALLLLALGFAVNTSVLNAAPLSVLGAERQAVSSSLAGLTVSAIAVSWLAPAGGFQAAALGVLCGLVASKLIMLPLYPRLGLPVGGWPELLLAAGICLWFTGSWLARGAQRDLVLAAGGVLSAALTLSLLHDTRLFQQEAPDGELSG